MEQKYLKLKPDYECYPVWEIGPDYVENLNPNDIPISKPLKEALNVWQDKYDQTLNRVDPASSGFKNDSELNLFEQEGQQLWKRLIDEIGAQYSVRYFSVKDNKLYNSPIELHH